MTQGVLEQGGGPWRKACSVKNVIALVLVIGVVTVSVLTRGPQVHGYICFFDEMTCSRAHEMGGQSISSKVYGNQSDGDDATPLAPVCKTADMYKLMACKGGGFNDDCCRGYHHFFHQNCVCSYDAWPRQYVGDDMNAMTWVRNIMKCNMSYAEVAGSSPCIEQVGTCSEPSEGDVRLSSHPRGQQRARVSEMPRPPCDPCAPFPSRLALTALRATLPLACRATAGLVLLWRNGAWGRVTGPGLTSELATNTCRRLGYADATEHTDAADVVWRFEHDLPTASDLANGTNQSASVFRSGIPATVHTLDCTLGSQPAACPLRVPAPIPPAASAVAEPTASPSPSPSPSSGRPSRPRPSPHPRPSPRTAPHPAPRPVSHTAVHAVRSPTPVPRGSHPAPNAPSSSPGASHVPLGPGAWVIGCGMALADGELVAGPQSCWLGRDGSRQCAGDANIATVACGTAVPHGTR